MKIFWSWQSDTPGKVGRHFVKGALVEAIAELKIDGEIEDPDRKALDEMHLDQDRMGVPGSPDLARLIFEKIAQSSVFLADVTPVGAILGDGGVILPKKLINSNVAIELGYALGTVSDRALLMVMNAHYGKRGDLPFDLQAKAGPLLYTLAPDAGKTAIERANFSLRNGLKAALKVSYLATREARQKRAEETAAMNGVSSADWERLSEKLASSCRFLRADSQWDSYAKRYVWRIAGGKGEMCSALLKQAGAMLLKSAKVRLELAPEVLSEPNSLTRWLLYLKQKGCHTVERFYTEELNDGSKINGWIGRIGALPEDSARICVECAALEI